MKISPLGGNHGVAFLGSRCVLVYPKKLWIGQRQINENNFTSQSGEAILAKTNIKPSVKKRGHIRNIAGSLQ